MKADLASFSLVSPPDLKGVLQLLSDHPGRYRALAGGTDVMVIFATGKLSHKEWINIRQLSELRGIEIGDAVITLGALTTYSEIQSNAVVREEFPMLCRAASETGGIAIQNRGTIGGNIVNASPAADSPPALLAYDAEVELSCVTGSRWIPYGFFHTGYKKMLLKEGELVTRVRMPRERRVRRLHYYEKVGPRRAQAIAKVCFAATADVSDGRVVSVRIALGGVAPTVIRCPTTAAALRDANLSEWPSALRPAKEALSLEIAPIDDVRSTASYRRKVAENLLVDFAAKLVHHVGLVSKSR